MKIVTVLVLWGIMPLNTSYNYDKHNLIACDDTSKIIEQIREQYKLVNINQTKYRMLEKDLMGETTEGGFMTAYIDQQYLRKIVTTYYKETGKVIIEYYFNHKDLFFAFAKEYHYNKPIDQPGSKVASVKQDRYYVSNKKMIRWLQGNSIQKLNTGAYKDETTNLLSESSRLYNNISNCHSSLKDPLVQDTVRCKYGSDCPSTGYILKGSRNACGEAVHVNPKNKSVKLEK